MLPIRPHTPIFKHAPKKTGPIQGDVAKKIVHLQNWTGKTTEHVNFRKFVKNRRSGKLRPVQKTTTRAHSHRRIIYEVNALNKNLSGIKRLNHFL